MLTKLIIEQVIDSQKERLDLLDTGMKREVPVMAATHNHALIITGVRRCGKSTLLNQINRSSEKGTIYVNFEDPRLAGFDLSDFERISRIATERKIKTFFFDEIQNIDKWENFIRFSLDEGNKIYITGSNASMLSRELGSRLTGRHLSIELFPFSYGEFLDFTGAAASQDSTREYLAKGGFPEMLKTNLPEMLMQVFNDIVVRDIAVRHGIRNTQVIRQLALRLISNTGAPVTGNSLKKSFDIGSSSSIMEYLSFLNDAYLFFFVPVFSYSQKVQVVNAKKVYAIDTGLITANSVSFSANDGRLLENVVFLHLRRRYREIFYFRGKRECDFVVTDRGKTKFLIQVCSQLNSDNLIRESEGLTEAMDFFKLNKGFIITPDQSDTLTEGKKKIIITPFSSWVR